MGIKTFPYMYHLNIMYIYIERWELMMENFSPSSSAGVGCGSQPAALVSGHTRTLLFDHYHSLYTSIYICIYTFGTSCFCQYTCGQNTPTHLSLPLCHQTLAQPLSIFVSVITINFQELPSKPGFCFCFLFLVSFS